MSCTSSGGAARKNNIKVQRAIAGLTQADLAEKTGVSRQTVNAIEKGKFVPSTVLALKMCSVFGKALDEVFQLEDSDWEK